MTPELLALLREKPRRVHEVAAALARAPVFVEGLLHALERQGLATRVEAEDHVLAWIASGGPEGNGACRGWRVDSKMKWRNSPLARNSSKPA